MSAFDVRLGKLSLRKTECIAFEILNVLYYVALWESFSPFYITRHSPSDQRDMHADAHSIRHVFTYSLLSSLR
jgi:hypothetical protein